MPRGSTPRLTRSASCVGLFLLTLLGCQESAPPAEQTAVDPDAGQFGASANVSELGELSPEELTHIAGMAAHHLCSGSQRRSSNGTSRVFLISAGSRILPTPSMPTPRPLR